MKGYENMHYMKGYEKTFYSYKISVNFFLEKHIFIECKIFIYYILALINKVLS